MASVAREPGHERSRRTSSGRTVAEEQCLVKRLPNFIAHNSAELRREWISSETETICLAVESQMRFLQRKRVISNMKAVVGHLDGSAPDEASLKQAFIRCLNGAQSTNLECIAGNLYLEFENPELVSLLIKKNVLSPEEVLDDRHVISVAERADLISLLEGAKDLIGRGDPNLYSLISELIGSVAAYRIADRDGGSVSCCVGLIWLSPHSDWTVEYCAEMLVHEFVHNSVFLEDMVRGIMQEPDLLAHEDALTLSAIRQTRRPYDKAFHSACVAATLMYLYHRLAKDELAAKFVTPLTSTLDELSEHDRLLRAKNLNVITENGREMLEELRRFLAGGPDYSSVAVALTRAERIGLAAVSA